MHNKLGFLTHGWRLGPLALALTALCAVGPVRADDAPVVNVDSGTLRGSADGGIRAFLGIPYAAPPVGALRWEPPQVPASWHGTREASTFGAACTQGEDRLYGLTPKHRSEDCLYLNVWAPPQADVPLPVMVWLHGGAHRIGTASIASYNGHALATRGVIVVTLNYRLGYLGYFSHPAIPGGNFGLMDQIAALRWVRDNIAAFGGDPGQVTVFGESAGGADVLYLMTTPAGRGLFRAAIVQSGGGWGKPLKPEAMQDKVVDALATIGMQKDLSAEALRQLDPQQLIKAQASDRDLGFGPFIDGKTVFETPAQVFATGREAKLPLIIGSNDWEGSLMKFRKPRLRDKLLAMWPPFADWYRGQADSADARIPLLFRDITFAAPARWIAQRHEPTWLYRFSHVTSSRRGKIPGAGHAAEIAYVFDTLDTLQQLERAIDDDDRRLAAELADCWASFAKYAAPRCAYAWEPYDRQRENALLIDEQPQQGTLPDAKVLDGVADYFGPGGYLNH